jgi:hypothetical protein
MRRKQLLHMATNDRPLGKQGYLDDFPNLADRGIGALGRAAGWESAPCLGALDCCRGAATRFAVIITRRSFEAVVAKLLVGEELRPVKEAIRPIEYRNEDRAMWRVGNVDVTAWAPNEVSCCHLTLVIGKGSFEHECLFEIGVLMQGDDGAWSHLEKDRRTPLIILVQHLHFDAFEVG